MYCNRLPLVAVFCLVGLVLPGRAQSGDRAAENALRQGTLPNGLRYAVLPHSSPRGDLSLRLIVRTGSLDERDDERGFAHFVEHMAFNGTRHFPPNALRLYFQQLGLRFGADINASTSFTQTQYFLDLPAGRADRLDDSLILLRDYADGILFAPEEVTKEAGVIMSELRARDSAGSRAATELLEVLYAGTRLPERIPIGVAEQIQSATAENLRSFYVRTYRPSRMTVVIVGPVDPAQTVEKIAAVFGSMVEPPVALPATPLPELPGSDSVKAEVVALPFLKSAQIRMLAAGIRPPDTPEGRREELVGRIATGLLHLRLNVQREKNITSVGSTNASYETPPLGNVTLHSLGISVASNNWDEGVQILETELRRALTNGFTQAEVDEAVATRLKVYGDRVASRASDSAEQVAARVADAIVAGRVWHTPKEDLAEATAALQGLTAAEVTSALEKLFPEEALRILLMIGTREAPKPERVIAAYHKSGKRNLRKTAESDEQLVFRYDNFGPAGQVTKRERVEDLDLTLVSFANGVRLNVRPSQLEPERFRLRIVFPLNHSHISGDRGGIADLAGHLLLSSNLKRHKQTEMERLMNLRGVRPQFSVNDGTPVLSINGPAEELAFALQFLTATLSDLDFDLDHYRSALSRYAGQHRSMLMNANPLALQHAVYAYTGNDPRVFRHPPQVLARIQPNETEGWLVNNILHGPLEIGLVGDLTPDDAIKAAAATVGTLKRRRAAPKPGTPLASPKKMHRQEGTAELPGSASLSCVLWPVDLPDTPVENAALGLATDVLRERLITVVREALGLSYSPTARVHRDLVQRDFAYAAMISTFETPRARQFTEASVRLAARIATQGVTEAEFRRALEPARTRVAANLRNNGWWLSSVVCLAQSRPHVLDEARQYGTVLDQLTIDDVNRAAQVFKPDRVTVTLLHPAPAKEDNRASKQAPEKK